MILDATAGNRKMWRNKNNPNIIYLDVERNLEVKPTIVADNTATPFRDKTFDTIFYDPPHAYGSYDFFYNFKTLDECRKVYPSARSTPSYYGWEKFKTKSSLIRHLYMASKEFKRILKDDGLLWFKWNEMAISLSTALSAFTEWDELMRIYVKSPTQTAGQAQTYWVCMSKKTAESSQSELTLYTLG